MATMTEALTPALTAHARQRCAEMGINTKVAKRIVQHHTLVYPAPFGHPPGRVLVSSVQYPEFLVVAAEDLHLIFTVLWNSQEEPLTREEANRRAREACG